MEVIPVLDLVGGQVVRAKMGDRDAYRPIVTPLSPTSDPVDVARGFLALHPFTALYVADLDAILQRGDNLSAVRRLRAAFPALTLLIDNGAADAKALAAILEEDLGLAVLGSESQKDGALVAANRGSDEVALSLDFRNERFLGPAAILESPDAWPRRVIVMTLARIGGSAGPDFERLRAVQAIAGSRKVYASGGVRGPADLARLKTLGCAGVLVASALHDGRLSRADLRRLRR
ncbi:MAG TPA: HisA/HisF-related TIM barrel protein [Roseiarcus sp.]|nr:HisA/HisF-related TIM barrel protein [Roseiarcus sp.]